MKKLFLCGVFLLSGCVFYETPFPPPAPDHHGRRHIARPYNQKHTERHRPMKGAPAEKAPTPHCCRTAPPPPPDR